MRCRCCGLEILPEETVFEDICPDCLLTDPDEPLPDLTYEAE